MEPRLHVAEHLPPSPFRHGSVTISPSRRTSEAVSLASPGTFKCRVYADSYTPEHYSCLPFSTLTMQNNLSFFYPCYQKSSGLHHSDSASDNADAPADVAPVSTHTSVPIYPYGWSYADVPVIGNSENSPTAVSDTAENYPRVARPRAAWECAPPASLMSCDYSFDAYQKPWLSTAETEHTKLCAPQTHWEQYNLTGTQLNRSQVPSDRSVSQGAWSHRASDHHAVVAPAQHAFLPETDYPSCETPGLPTSSHSSTSQVHTSFDGVRSWMAQSLLGQLPSLSHHRRRFGRSHPYPDRVTCDKCQKQMRPQSLKRHIREVHDRIKRHVKSGFRTGPLLPTRD